MSQLRKAAQQALEALIGAGDDMDVAMQDAFVALRAALAQSEQEAVMVNGLTEAETNASASVMGLNRPKAEQEPAAIVAMDVSSVHMSYAGKYIGQKPDTKIAMLLKDLPVGTPLYVTVGMGVSNE